MASEWGRSVRLIKSTRGSGQPSADLHVNMAVGPCHGLLEGLPNGKPGADPVGLDPSPEV